MVFPFASRLRAKLQLQVIPRLLRLHYDFKAVWSPHLTILNCGYDPGIAMPAWAVQELAAVGEKADPAGAALYLHLAAAVGARCRGGAAATAPGRASWAGLRVLEVGCGLGGGARCLAALLRPEAYVAVDASGLSVAACRRWHARLLRPLPVTYEVADATRLEEAFRPGSFDVVLLVQSAHSVVDAGKLCQGLGRVLKRDGVLLLADHFRSRRWSGLKARLGEAGLVCLHEEDITPRVTHRSRLPADMRYVVAGFRQRAA